MMRSDKIDMLLSVLFLIADVVYWYVIYKTSKYIVAIGVEYLVFIMIGGAIFTLFVICRLTSAWGTYLKYRKIEKEVCKE